MKPLLAVPELLPEDAHVWSVVTFWAEIKHFQLGSRLFASSLYADRRDAELMHLCTRYSAAGGPGTLPLVYVMLRLDPQWPTGPHGLGLVS